MSNLKICYLNRADSATLTASPAADAACPVTYLANDDRGYVFRSTSLAAQDIIGDWGGAAMTIGCAVLYRHNLLATDTWRLRLYSDTARTTMVYDSGDLSAYAAGLFDSWEWGFSTHYFTAITTAKAFKITVTSAAADGYVEIGRLVLGDLVTATYNPRYGLSLCWDDGAAISRSPGGSRSAIVRGRYRRLRFDLLAEGETERAAWLEIGRHAGIVRTVWITSAAGLGGTKERDASILGAFDEPIEQRFSTWNLYDHQIQLSEV